MIIYIYIKFVFNPLIYNHKRGIINTLDSFFIITLLIKTESCTFVYLTS